MPSGNYVKGIIKKEQIRLYGRFALSLLHCRMSQRCHQVMHFLFAADVVGFIDNCLLLFLGHGGIGIHRRLIRRQSHAKANGERSERRRGREERGERVAAVGEE